jgi:hypothetical protein
LCVALVNKIFKTESVEGGSRGREVVVVVVLVSEEEVEEDEEEEEEEFVAPNRMSEIERR